MSRMSTEERLAQPPKLTAELARHHFGYDPETGALWWKVPRARQVKIGASAGCVNGSGYYNVRFCCATYAVHRVAWLMVHGVVPQILDHINGCRTDNRIENLRPSSPQENAQNQRRARRDNKRAGLLGAAFHKASGKFRARIGTPDGKQRHLGAIRDGRAGACRIPGGQAPSARRLFNLKGQP